MKIQPYIIAPTLIKQPTWGGQWIVSHKNFSDPQVNQVNIGQSYELFSNTQLTTAHNTEHQPAVLLADPQDPEQSKLISGNENQLFPIQKLIDADPTAVLGQKSEEDSIETMIKLNQARGNSYQVHTEEPMGSWLPKPESWYFIEPGVVTLGIKKLDDLDRYRASCTAIYNESLNISKQIQSGSLLIEEGRKKLHAFIKQNDPAKFVNRIQVAKGMGIDLSAGGVHHSWEESDKTYPDGNVVYEVQKNVYDPSCTLRSFDKGKIKDDGTVRELHIDDYFEALNTSEESNNPASHYRKGSIIKKTSTYTIKEIFDATDYSLVRLTLNGPIQNQHTTTSESFHHLFAESGGFQVILEEQVWNVTQGFSIFIPASTGTYNIKPYKSKHSAVLRTSL